MPLYWAADTDGARYCIRAADMLEAVKAFRAVMAMDPEGIDLAAGDDVELIGFDPLDAAKIESPPPSANDEWTEGDVLCVLLARRKALGEQLAVSDDEVRATFGWVLFPTTGKPPVATREKVRDRVTRDELDESRRHEDGA